MEEKKIAKLHSVSPLYFLLLIFLEEVEETFNATIFYVVVSCTKTVCEEANTGWNSQSKQAGTDLALDDTSRPRMLLNDSTKEQ